MSLWKDFCRTLESDLVRTHYGPIAEQLDYFAVFMLEASQLGQLWATNFEPQEDGPALPPFPFPKMCLVHDDIVVAFDEPEVDEDAQLRCSMVLFIPGTQESLPIRVLALATVVVPADTQTHFDLEIEDFRGVYWPPGPHDPQVFDPEHPPESVPDVFAVYDEAMKELADAEVQITALQRKRVRTKQDQARLEDLLAAARTYKRLSEEVGEIVEKSKAASRDMAERVSEFCHVEFSRSILAIAYINERFVVESVEGKVKPPGRPSKSKKKKRKVMRRLHERPRYIIVDRAALSELWHEAHTEGTRTSPIPHLRRGHYRTLARQENQRVWVRPHAVGGDLIEWRNGPVYYRVVQ